jgi:C4-dicarboxylate-specific signal transduction histidine kinase
LLGSPLEILTKQNFEEVFGIKPLEHGTFQLPDNILAKQGASQTSYIELHFNMVMYDTHRLYYVTLRDVADKIRAEKLEKETSELMNFRQNQMAIAEMATTIAHEINQPLAAIQNYATSAINFHQQGNNSPEKISLSLEQLIKQADIASDIVKQARGQLGRNDYPQAPLELVKTVYNTIDLCQLRAEKSKVTIHFSSTIAEAWIVANEVQVKQLLINLISNALEVLSETNNSAGNITLSLDFEDEYYVLYVEDNGPGITDISRVFTTHYTTKKNGLGMGLSICRSIAEMHHGSISANNMSQGGARFSLKIPVYEPNEELIKITTSVN